jgi:hypothetical protein
LLIIPVSNSNQSLKECAPSIFIASADGKRKVSNLALNFLFMKLIFNRWNFFLFR